MEPIDINRLIFIDYIDYIDWFPMSDFHRLDTSGGGGKRGGIRKITRKKVQRGGSQQEKGREPGLKGKGSKKIGLAVRSLPPITFKG